MIRERLVALLIITAFLVYPSSNGAIQDRTTYDDVASGMRHFQNKLGDLEYEYRVGRSLHFGIVRPGKPDRSIYFYAASFEGDYFAVVNISADCVVVRPGQTASAAKRADLAFVSTRNGKVYRTLEDCSAAK